MTKLPEKNLARACPTCQQLLSVEGLVATGAVVCANCFSLIDSEVLGLQVAEHTQKRETFSSFLEILKQTIIPSQCGNWPRAAGYSAVLSCIPFVGVFAIASGFISLQTKKKLQVPELVRALLGLTLGGLSTAVYLFLAYVARGEFPFCLLFNLVILAGAFISMAWYFVKARLPKKN
jgi:hypothetical protein